MEQEAYYGEIQSGHLEQVGYDTYCNLLDEVVKEMKGIDFKKEEEIQIDLDVTSYIPDEYISDANQKIEVYQNIALCKNEQDIEDVIDEIVDRFGDLPKEAENLIQIARIKNACREIGVNKISQKESTIVYWFDSDSFKTEWIDELLQKFRNQIKFSPAKDPYITYKIKDERNVLSEVQNFLKIL